MKGPIFHKILYKLSKEQQKQLLGEEIRLDTALNLQHRLKKTLENVFFICSDCSSSKLQLRQEDSLALGNPDKLICLCHHCGQATDFLEIEHFRPKAVEELVKVYEEPKRKELVGRVTDIITQLREIPDDESICADGFYSMHVTLLLDELKGVLDQIVKKRTRHFVKLRLEHVNNPLCDLRRRYRTLTAFLFKNLPDFSGCEDETGLTEPAVKQNNSSFKIRKLCSTIKNHYLPRLIP